MSEIVVRVVDRLPRFADEAEFPPLPEIIGKNRLMLYESPEQPELARVASILIQYCVAEKAWQAVPMIFFITRASARTSRDDFLRLSAALDALHEAKMLEIVMLKHTMRQFIVFKPELIHKVLAESELLRG